MKVRLITALIMAGMLTPAFAQVASHAPTTAVKTPASQTTTLQPTGNAVAKVNGAVLTDKDLLREMYAIFPYAKQHSGFPKAQEAEIRQGALEMIIFEEMVYQEAQRRKMTIPAAKIDQAEIAFRKQFENSGQFQQFMQSEMHGSRQQLRTQIERSMLIDQLLKQEVDNKSAVTVAQVRAYYDKNGARFQVPDSYSFQSISVIPPLKSTPAQAAEAKKKATDALAQAKATKSSQEFGLLAEKISEDDYRVNMGDHKVVPTGKLPPQIIAAFKAMKPGQVSGLIQIETAYTIVRLNAHTPEHKQNFEEVKSDLRLELQKQRYEQLRVSLAKELRAKSKIELG
jgi:parvulin-like peptidyl-prolyl isomerase